MLSDFRDPSIALGTARSTGSQIQCATNGALGTAPTTGSQMPRATNGALDTARSTGSQMPRATNAFDRTFHATAQWNEGHFVADMWPLVTSGECVEWMAPTRCARKTPELEGGLCNADSVVDGRPLGRTLPMRTVCEAANAGKTRLNAENVVTDGQRMERRPVDGRQGERRSAAASVTVTAEALRALPNADNVVVDCKSVKERLATASATVTTKASATLYNADNVVDDRAMKTRHPAVSTFVTTEANSPSRDTVPNVAHAIDGSPQRARTSLLTAQRLPKIVPTDVLHPATGTHTDMPLLQPTGSDRSHHVVPQNKREQEASRRYSPGSCDGRAASCMTQCVLGGHSGCVETCPVQRPESTRCASRRCVLPSRDGAVAATHGVPSLAVPVCVHVSGGLASPMAKPSSEQCWSPMTLVHSDGGDVPTRPAPLNTRGLPSQIPTPAHDGCSASIITIPLHAESLTSHEGGKASLTNTPLHAEGVTLQEGGLASLITTPLHAEGLTSHVGDSAPVGTTPLYESCMASSAPTLIDGERITPTITGVAPSYEARTWLSTREGAVNADEPQCIDKPIPHSNPLGDSGDAFSPIIDPKCNLSTDLNSSRLTVRTPAISPFHNAPSLASSLVSGTAMVHPSADAPINPDIKNLYVFTSEKNKSFDKNLQLRVIEELSLDTPHMRHALSMDRKNDERIARMRAAFNALTPHELRDFDARATALAREPQQSDAAHACAVIDMDMFFAACELRERPDLCELPVAVGHKIISTANYVARAYGVRSAMPGFIAEELVKRQGNTLVFLPVNYEKYKHASRVVQEVLESWNLSFKCPSLDEFYISCDGLSLSDTAELMNKVRADIQSVTGLTASAGIGPTFMFAKMAADVNKPNGQFVVPHELDDRRAWLGPLSVRKLSGVGKVTQKILEAFGLFTLQDIVDKKATVLALLGTSSTSYGPFLVHAALGHTCGSSWELHQTDVQKSISQETTFPALSDAPELRGILFELCARVWDECETHELFPRTLTVKIKKASFDTMTRCRTSANPIRSLDALEVVAWELLCLFKLHGTFPRLRLLGVRGSQWYDENDDARAADARASKKRASLVCAATRTEKPIDSFFSKKQKTEKKPAKPPGQSGVIIDLLDDSD